MRRKLLWLLLGVYLLIPSRTWANPGLINIAPIAASGGTWSSSANMIDANEATTYTRYYGVGETRFIREFSGQHCVYEAWILSKLNTTGKTYYVKVGLSTDGVNYSWSETTAKSGTSWQWTSWTFTGNLAKYVMLSISASAPEVSVTCAEFKIMTSDSTMTLTAQATSDFVLLTWTDTTPPYTVRRNTVQIASTQSSSYHDEDYPGGQLVTYQVTDANNDIATVAIYTPPAAPTVTADPDVYSVLLSWQPVPTATSYLIYRDDHQVGQTASTTYTDQSLAPSTSFVYIVSAINGYGEGHKSSGVLVTTDEQPPPPQAPSNLRLLNRGSTSLEVGWDAVPGVSGYKTYVNGVLQGLTGALSYSVSSLNVGTSYSIVVQAYSGGLNGAPTAPLVTTTIGLPGPVTGLAATPAPTSVALGWTAPATPDTPTGYRVYQEDSLLGQVTGLSYPVIGLQSQTSYTFKVSAVTEAGEGPASQVQTTTLLLALDAPTGLAGASTPRTLTLTWSPAPGATSYAVYLNTIQLGRVTACTYTFLALVPETQYTLGVASQCKDGDSNPATLAATTGAGEVQIQASAYGTGYVARWTPPSASLRDAPDSYSVYIDAALVGSGLHSTYLGDSKAGWPSGSSHEIRVDAVYGGQAHSTAVTVTALVSSDPVDPDDPTQGLSFSIVSLWPLLATVTAISLGWLAYDKLIQLITR